MTRITVVAGITLSLAALLAYVLIQDTESFSPATFPNRAGVEHDSGRSRDAESVGSSAIQETTANLSNQSIGQNEKYDEEFLELIRVEAGLNTEGQARQFSKTLDKLSEITGRDPRSVLFELRMRETPLVPVGAKADQFFREHGTETDQTAVALEGRVLNEIWRFSDHLDELPAFVDVECLVPVCRATVEFPHGYEDALPGATFGAVKMALYIELQEHGIIRVSEGPANPSSDMRNLYLWREEGGGPEWEAYLPVIPEAVKAMIAEGLNRQQNAELSDD
jgi:hypothetical protein